MKEASASVLADLPQQSNITDLLLRQATDNPQLALYSRKVEGVWRDVSAADFQAQVRAVAKGLLAVGVSPGDPVAVFSRTRYEWTVVDFAIWYAGGVTVPIYETSSPSQVEWILQDSGALRVITENARNTDLVVGVVQGSPTLDLAPVACWQMDDDGGATLATLAGLGSGVSDAELERSRSAATLADPASLVYTSGTTGRPKGCLLTHANFALMGVNTVPFLPELLHPGARTLMFLPLAHVLARAVQVACLVSGTTLGHTSSARELLADLETYRPTFLLCIPRIYEKILASAQDNARANGRSRLFAAAHATAVAYSRRLEAPGNGPGLLLRARHTLFDALVYRRVRAAFGGRLQYTVSGASRLNPVVAHFFRGAGVPVLEGYGLTESTAPCTVNTPRSARLGSVGIPLPGTTVRIADDGEVLAKGIGMFEGYHANPEATAAAFTDGWFLTGDLGRLDSDGFLYITGRKKDLLVTAGGKNVAPGPLEEVLRESPLVLDAVVVGEGRPYIAALLTLDPDGVAGFAQDRGLGTLSLSDAAGRADIRRAVQDVVDRANDTVSTAESIRKFVLLAQGFSVEAGQLTPSLKVRRAVVVQDFGPDIEGLYR